MSQNQNNNKISYLAYIICILATFYYFYEFLLRVMPSVMSHELMTDLNISAFGFGLLGSFFFWGYASFQIPAGMLLDRFGPRKILTASVFLCALATYAFGTTEHFGVASASRFAIGVASSSAYLGVLVIAARWFPPKRFIMIAGLAQVMGCLGAIAGQAPIALAVHHFGWRQTTFLIAAIAAILGILFWLIIRDSPKNYSNDRTQKPEHIPLTEQLKLIFMNKQTIWVGLFAITTWTPVTIFAALWGPSFLQLHYHTNEIRAGNLLTAIWIGISVGGPFLGWISDHIRSRIIPCIGTTLLSVVMSIILIYTNISYTLLYIVLFFYGFAASSQAVTFGMMKDLVPANTAGTAVGYNNMMVILGAVILQPLVGVILNTLSPEHLYTLRHYQIALTMVPVTSVLGLVLITFFVKETYPKP